MGDKSSAYYSMLVSDSFFTGRENLAIRVIATSPGSDPDIFISKVRDITMWNLFFS